MESFLSPSDYKKNYKCFDSAKIQCRKKEDLEKYITSSIGDEIYHQRINSWNELEKIIIDSRKKIKSRQLFIRNLKEIYDGDSDYILKDYNIDKEFDCIEKGYFYVAQKDSITYSPDERKKVTIKLTDIHRAYELGINDINEIYEIILKKKKIESII